MKRPIYFDYAATTPVDPRVAEKMCAYLLPEGKFGNPASATHAYGWEAMAAVEAARGEVAALINAERRDIIWTSGATEGNNLAIQGAAYFHGATKRHIVTVRTEHKAVLDTCRHLERQGFTVTYLPVNAQGLIDINALTAAISPDTLLVSVMHVNNETGVVQDIAAIGAICRAHNILFHVDAVQSVGKLPIDLHTLPVDMMSFSAHKLYGPKGIGALFVRHKPRVRIQALIFGGGHENGLRSGTLATHQIVGMGTAFELAHAEMDTEIPRIGTLRDALWTGLQTVPGVTLNGDNAPRVAGHLNISVAGVEGEALLMALSDLAISSGSACNSASMEPSHVLQAMGVKNELAHSSLRFSLGRYTTGSDVEAAITSFVAAVTRLRAMSPLPTETIAG
jgi:cysteine desulfurase